MPAGARVLHVDVQAHDLYAWALVDPAQPSVTRMFVLRGTGHKLPDVPLKHVGTALDYGVGLVWHVFEDVR